MAYSMNPLTIPIVRPLKKSFVIVGLVFLFIGFAIEFGVPLPNLQEMAGKGKRKVKDKFAKEYWEDVKDDVAKAIQAAKKSPSFEIQMEDKNKDLKIFGFTIKADKEKGDEERDPIKVSINFSPSDQKMLEEAKGKVIEEKWKKMQVDMKDAMSKKKLDAKGEKPPGFSLKADGLYLWILFFSILISFIGMVVSKSSVQRIGMIASLINSIIVIFMCIFLIVKAIIKLIMIFILIFSFFVFLYPIIFEFPFPTGTVLSLAGSGIFCKIVAAILLWIGGSNIIKIKSFTLLNLMGFVTSIIILFVLPIAKALLAASIADPIIGIIIAIIVIIWSIYILIGSIRGLVSSVI